MLAEFMEYPEHLVWINRAQRQIIIGVPSIGLHVYGVDILSLPRRMWNPETLEEHPLDWALYESFAQAASKAGSAPLN